MGLFKSAYAAIYKTFRSILKRGSLNVGGTAGYPRVELHSFTEGEPLDKGSQLRRIEMTIESMSNKDLAEAVRMAEDNLDILLRDAGVAGDFQVIGVIPTQLRDLTEVSDTQQVIYRILQTMTVFVEQS